MWSDLNKWCLLAERVMVKEGGRGVDDLAWKLSITVRLLHDMYFTWSVTVQGPDGMAE